MNLYNNHKKKILYSAILNSHILNFHIPYLKWLKENNYEIYVITKDKGDIPFCDVKIEVDFPKGINIIKTIRVISKVKEILKKEKFDIIQLNTSIDAAIIRYAYKKSNIKSKVIYTMHNLYVYKNSGLINYLIYYPIERHLSKVTDVLVAINDEDYEFCKKKFKAKEIIKINGIGIDENRFYNINNNCIREKLGFKENDYLLVYPAEIRKRKNQLLAIKAMKILVKKYNNIYLLLIGKDSTNGKYINKVKKLGLEKNILFLGYKENILDYLKIANLQISTSKQEGLPIGILEGIYINNKRNAELVSKYNKGILLKNNNVKELAEEIEAVYIGEKLKEQKSNQNDFEEYTLNSVMPKYIELYL